VWVKYGEANAVLAGDALLALAFQVAAKAPRNAAGIVSVLARAGVGVVQGQVEDLAIGRDGAAAAADADFVYRHKTADLFVAAALSGALAAGAGEAELAALEEYALELGLAFQYVDDLLDGDGAYPKERTAELAAGCTAAAVAALGRLPGDTSRLEELAAALARRTV
jgi:geranylgeranyl pyrophosphate synthase